MAKPKKLPRPQVGRTSGISSEVGVIYARYSSHAQKDASIEQQVKQQMGFLRSAKTR